MGKNLNMEEIIHIGQLIEATVLQRKQDIIQVFRDQLNHRAQEVIESDPMTDDMIYNAAYLIPWEQEPEFSQNVEAIDQQFGDRGRDTMISLRGLTLTTGRPAIARQILLTFSRYLDWGL